MPDSPLEESPSKHLLGVRTMDQRTIKHFFTMADHFKQILNRPLKKVPTLRHITVANVFFEPSTRTRISFELAAKRLSADVVNFTSNSSAIQKGESLLDTLRNILHMKVDVLVIRHNTPGAAHLAAKYLNCSVINAGDGTHEHPTQALLDAYSMKQELGELKNKRILLLGDIMHSRVALSNIFCLQKLGAHISVCGPPTLIPIHIQQLGVHIYYELKDALSNCDIVNVLRIQLERQQKNLIPSLREYANHYALTQKHLNHLSKPIPILHPGPLNRGIEIQSEVADSPNARILEQVENGLAIRMAVLYTLAGKIAKNNLKNQYE